MRQAGVSVKPVATWRFALSHPLHLLAVGFGSGLARVFPGTFGTLFGWLVYITLSPVLPDWAWLVLIVGSFVAGIWICDKAGRALGVIDHGAIVWDEIVAIWLVLWVCADQLSSPIEQLLCVAVFRFFDMVKPPPIRWFDQQLKNALGVMLDDIVAAFMSLLVLAIWVYVF